MTLEVRIPISPQPTWLNRTRLLAASIREFYPDAIVRAYVGQPGGQTPELSRRVENALRGFGIEWIGRDEFDEWAGTANPYVATMIRRYRPPYSGSHILQLDADVVCTGRFDELFGNDGLSGVQAHVPPFSRAAWAVLYREAGLPPGWEERQYSGWLTMFNDPSARLGPPYLNTGAVFGPAASFAQIHHAYSTIAANMRRCMNSYFFDQIALTLAAAATGAQIHDLPLRFNFPNQAAFDQRHPAELGDVRFLHYLRTDTVDRDRDFEDLPAMRRMLARADLQGSNEVLRRRMAELIGALEPSALACAEDAPWA